MVARVNHTTMVGESFSPGVPIQTIPTVYPRLGDWVGLASVLALVGMVLVVVGKSLLARFRATG